MPAPLLLNAVQDILARRQRQSELDQQQEFQGEQNDQNRALQLTEMGQRAAAEPMRQATMTDRVKEQAAGAQLRQMLANRGKLEAEEAEGKWRQNVAQTQADAKRDVQDGRVDQERIRTDGVYAKAVIEARASETRSRAMTRAAEIRAKGDLSVAEERSRGNLRTQEERNKRPVVVGGSAGGTPQARIAAARAQANAIRTNTMNQIAKVEQWEPGKLENVLSVANGGIDAHRAAALNAEIELHPESDPNNPNADPDAMDALMDRIEREYPYATKPMAKEPAAKK